MQAAGLYDFCSFGRVAATGCSSMWLPSDMMQQRSLSSHARPWTAGDGPVETNLQPFINHHMKGKSSSVKVSRSESHSDSSELAKGDVETREGSENARTTVMLRNLPDNYTRDMLIDLLETEGFGDAYDFLYLPIDFRTQAAYSYGVVN